MESGSSSHFLFVSRKDTQYWETVFNERSAFNVTLFALRVEKVLGPVYDRSLRKFVDKIGAAMNPVYQSFLAPLVNPVRLIFVSQFERVCLSVHSLSTKLPTPAFVRASIESSCQKPGYTVSSFLLASALLLLFRLRHIFGSPKEKADVNGVHKKANAMMTSSKTSDVSDAAELVPENVTVDDEDEAEQFSAHSAKTQKTSNLVEKQENGPKKKSKKKK